MKVKIEAFVDDVGERLEGKDVVETLEKTLGLKVESVSIHELG